jgi:glutamyl-tRNA(Gln) amidotransferase subunit E
MTGGFKPFDEMTAEDYAEIGLRCGLEVHQQILTDRKLFCRCPAGRYGEQYDAEILRHMRPTLSEFGEYDGTALMEKKTRKNIRYRIHHETVCTYEFDDTPPFPMDDRALDIAIELALLLRLNMVSEIHIARKQYLDGSIPAGFQRTTILGVDGWIPYNDRRIDIHQLGLEEDSCREVSDIGHDRVYLTDRLGMPLIEVVTAPQMRTPQETAEVCQIIRKLCCSTRKVRRGYGAIRQDVNVSVESGTRIEIKGVPQIGRIPHLIYNEARRQVCLLRIRDRLASVGVTRDTFAHSTHDVTRVVAQAMYEPIHRAIEKGNQVRCVVLKRFEGVLNAPTQEHTTFATEFADRIRVIACLSMLPNMVHSDSAAESISARHWKNIRRRTGADPEDALVLVWGDERDTVTACQEIANRALEATIGVPSDTRQALKDGTNGFERVLPGAERMYPDTDLPPIPLAPERVARIRASLPAYVWDREAACRRLGVRHHLVETLTLSGRMDLFFRLVDSLEIDPTHASVLLGEQLKALRRAWFEPSALSDDVIFALLSRHTAGRLAREGILPVLRHLLERITRDEGDTFFNQLRSDPGGVIDVALSDLDLTPILGAEVESRVAATWTASDERAFPTVEHRRRFVMGELMAVLRGRFEGRGLAELVDARPAARADAKGVTG